VAKTLKQLTKIWYKKLKDEGFKDIEQDELYLKRWSNEFVRPDANVKNRSDYNVRPTTVRNKKNEFQDKQDYYYYATQFLNEYPFANNKERIIWEYHVNGISMRAISKLLKKVRIRISRQTVYKIINRLATQMKAKYFK
jgi:hypothetical protein